jgi:outer membrane lipoprotein-sorting protein
MRLDRSAFFPAVLALFLAPLAFAPTQAVAEDNQQQKAKVLERLNAAAATFHSTSADVEVDDEITDPIYEKEVYKGIVYYERNGSGFRIGVHFNQRNGKPSTKAYTYVGGTLSVHESGTGEVTNYKGAGKFESYVILGFGASGKDLESKWEIKYLGSETIGGVKAEILELVAKDPEVKKNLPKVTIWVDADRAVSLKQVLTLSATSSKTCLYSNFKLNKKLPDEAFTFKLDK